MDKNNLVYARVTNHQAMEAEQNMRMVTLNARSLRNKDHIILQELHESNVDVAVITKTWLKDTDADDSWLNQSELKQSNYDILMHNRQDPKKGAGIALIHKLEYGNKIKLLEKNTTMTMECITADSFTGNKPIHIVGIYHPPPSSDNQTTNMIFIDEITDLLTKNITKLDNLIILGHFNINTEDNTNTENTIFNDTMKALLLEQHVQGLMHRLRSTLNLIFTQLESEVKVTNTTKHCYISEHCMVSIDLHLHKLRYPKIEKTIRDRTKLTNEAMISNFNAPSIDVNDSLDQACHQFNTKLLKALDRTAPLKTIKHSDKPRQPWLNKHIRDQRKIVRSQQWV